MAIISEKTDGHWNYFLSIEADLERLSRYVEFDELNYHCFSVEIARILMAAAAETDVVCKQICKSINAGSTADNIHNYRDEIVPAFPIIPRFEVRAPHYGLRLKPWGEWNQPNGVPLWWTAYNKVKHERNTEYHRANLKNALNAVSGLFVACLYLYREKAELGELRPSPNILRPAEDRFDGIMQAGFEVTLCYKLKE